mgnify:CR=1 FL=1
MNAITHQRCFNHRQREAAARCPECRRFFCRECVTEHEDRVICAACLRLLSQRSKGHSSNMDRCLVGTGAVAGFVLTWLIFLLLGKSLLSLPSSFHEGTLWRETPIGYDDED